MRVLVADDMQDARDLFAFAFALEGFDTCTARNGAEAVDAVRESLKPFDVIVLDIEMPQMDGWQALKAIRQLPQCQQIPIVMFTAYDRYVGDRAVQEGANPGQSHWSAGKSLR